MLSGTDLSQKAVVIVILFIVLPITAMQTFQIFSPQSNFLIKTFGSITNFLLALVVYMIILMGILLEIVRYPHEQNTSLDRDLAWYLCIIFCYTVANAVFQVLVKAYWKSFPVADRLLLEAIQIFIMLASLLWVIFYRETTTESQIQKA